MLCLPRSSKRNAGCGQIQLQTTIRDAIDKEDFEIARLQLTNLESEGDCRVETLRNDLERRFQYRDSLVRAENELYEKRFRDAEFILLEEIAKSPPDNRAQILLNRVTIERDQYERETGNSGCS